MGPLTALAQALGLAWSSGISLYATVAFTGIAARLGWIALPAPLAAFTNGWVIGIAVALTVLETLAALIPGVATAWEAAHTAVRPLASAALAVLVAWGGSPSLAIAAGLLGGGLGLATHVTKLKLRTAIDASPEPFSNGLASGAELGAVAGLSWLVWHYPFLALAVALGVLVVLALVARALWRTLRRAAGWLSGEQRP